MKKFQAKLLTFLFLSSLMLGLLASCDKKASKTGTLIDFVPNSASIVLKISNWETWNADIQNNSLFMAFKDTPPLFFLNNSELLKTLHPTSQSLFCVNKLNDSLSAFTFIAKHSKNLFRIDSIKNKTIETLKMGNQSFQRITVDKNIAYSTLIDSVLVISSSQQILRQILNGETERGTTFKKVYSLPSSGEVTAMLRGTKIMMGDSSKINFTSWSTLDLAIAPESFTATGVTLATDTLPQLLNVFEGQVPQQNNMAKLVPNDALGAISLTFNDAEKFQKKLQLFRGEKTTQPSGVFGSVSEVGAIELQDGTAIFIKSIDASLTQDALARFVTSKSMFREIEISSFSEAQLFKRTFFPFINSENANFVFQLENFFVFTESESAAEYIISAFLNNFTLSNTSYFKDTATNLSTASSLLILKMQGNFSGTVLELFNINGKKGLTDFPAEKFPLAALQLSYDRNFAHVTLSCKEIGGTIKNISGGISEKFNNTLESAILGDPQLFGNGGNVVVQDIGNKLYLISESGKIIWSKKLDGAILGEIEEIDLFGNGKKQMAFATKNSLYVLDRNGKDAKAFPLKFKDEVTQPLSVFDYDNNHKYRFVLVQGKSVLMYNKQGSAVKGFGFKKAKSQIVHPPMHFRMGNKDYITIAEENGKLNILSRVGKSRITVSKSLNFSEIPIAEEDNTFVIITKENAKVRISQDGKVSSQKLDVGNNYWFTTNGSTKVTIDTNLLRINGKLAQLPLGVYTKPEIFKLNRNYYIAVTEIQEKKVYVFNNNGNLLKGFPVYGTSAASINEGNGKQKLQLAVKGEANSAILYSSN